jgi:hypothetical protein
MLDSHMIVCAGSDFGGPNPDEALPNTQYFY